MNLNDLVLQELEGLNIPTSYKVDIRHWSEVYPNDPNPINSQFIQISIGSSMEDSTHDAQCSYLDFWYNQDQERIEHVNFSLKKEMKDQGFGRGLVEMMEKIGKELGCNSVRINLNTNPSFWEHMGYKNLEEYWEKSI